MKEAILAGLWCLVNSGTAPVTVGVVISGYGCGH